LGEDTADGQANLFAEVFEIALTFGSMQGLILLAEVSSFGNVDNLFDENAIEHANFLLVEVAIGLFFVLEVHCRDLCKQLNRFNSCRRWSN